MKVLLLEKFQNNNHQWKVINIDAEIKVGDAYFFKLE